MYFSRECVTIASDSNVLRDPLWRHPQIAKSEWDAMPICCPFIALLGFVISYKVWWCMYCFTNCLCIHLKFGVCYMVNINTKPSFARSHKHSNPVSTAIILSQEQNLYMRSSAAIWISSYTLISVLTRSWQSIFRSVVYRERHRYM